MAVLVLIETGIILAKKVFSLVREGDSLIKDISGELKSEVSIEKNKEEILSSLEKISNQIQQAKNQIIFEIIDKIESENLERLISRVNSIQLVIELDQKESISVLYTQLMESNDYAKNRILEGKKHWVGAWIIGSATKLMLLKLMSESKKTQNVLAREANKFRIDILDFYKNNLFLKDTPWIEISEFVKGDNENLLEKFRKSDILINKEKNPIKTNENKNELLMDEDHNKSIVEKNILAPRAAWPFRTGNEN